MSATFRSIRGNPKSIGMDIRDLANRAENSSRVWPSVGSYISREMKKQFVTEGSHLNGRKWTPVKPEYRLWKLRNGFSRKTLVQTGRMKSGFTGRPMDIEVYHGNSAEFGSSNPKAVWHHYGTTRNGKRVNPPRRIIKVTPTMRKDIKKIIQRWIKSGVLS